MKGTEKQIKWAESIQRCKIEDLKKCTHPSYKTIQENLEANIKILEAMDDAKFWIENKDDDVKTVLRYIELEKK